MSLLLRRHLDSAPHSCPFLTLLDTSSISNNVLSFLPHNDWLSLHLVCHALYKHVQKSLDIEKETFEKIWGRQLINPHTSDWRGLNNFLTARHVRADELFPELISCILRPKTAEEKEKELEEEPLPLGVPSPVDGAFTSLKSVIRFANHTGHALRVFIQPGVYDEGNDILDVSSYMELIGDPSTSPDHDAVPHVHLKGFFRITSTTGGLIMNLSIQGSLSLCLRRPPLSKSSETFLVTNCDFKDMPRALFDNTLEKRECLILPDFSYGLLVSRNRFSTSEVAIAFLDYNCSGLVSNNLFCDLNIGVDVRFGNVEDICLRQNRFERNKVSIHLRYRGNVSVERNKFFNDTLSVLSQGDRVAVKENRFEGCQKAVFLRAGACVSNRFVGVEEIAVEAVPQTKDGTLDINGNMFEECGNGVELSCCIHVQGRDYWDAVEINQNVITKMSRCALAMRLRGLREVRVSGNVIESGLQVPGIVLEGTKIGEYGLVVQNKEIERSRDRSKAKGIHVFDNVVDAIDPPRFDSQVTVVDYLDPY